MTNLPYHPLADLFPLIEGEEFAELVVSIKENGQHDPIVLLDGAVLDGRNRYRACLAAGIEPKVEQFSGSDPVRFVMDHNIFRRHLNVSQRSLIAAKLSLLSQSGTRTDLVSKDIRPPTIMETAEILHVSRPSVVRAKKILTEGTEEEIKAVEQGRATVTKIVGRILSGRKPVERKSLSDVGKNPERIQKQRINAQVWGQLRDALINLTSMPRAVDVVTLARIHDKTGLVDMRVEKALNWLGEFSDAWTRHSRHNADESKDRDSNAYAGDGYKSAGTQQT